MSIEEEHRPSVSGDSDDDQEENDDFRQLVAKQNKKKKKSGGFQSMGLDRDVFRGVVKKGYRVPTPIQRKVIITYCESIGSSPLRSGQRSPGSEVTHALDLGF